MHADQLHETPSQFLITVLNTCTFSEFFYVRAENSRFLARKLYGPKNLEFSALTKFTKLCKIIFTTSYLIPLGNFKIKCVFISKKSLRYFYFDYIALACLLCQLLTLKLSFQYVKLLNLKLFIFTSPVFCRRSS